MVTCMETCMMIVIILISQIQMQSQSDKVRERFRQEIRQRHIRELMKVHRNSMQYSHSSSIFHELDQQVRQSTHLSISMDMVTRLTALLDSHPEHENTYTLIGNYIFDHPAACPYFRLRLMSMSSIARFRESYLWVLKLLVLKSEEVDGNFLEELDATISDIIEESANELELKQSLRVLQLILALESDGSALKYLPIKSLKALNSKLRKVDVLRLRLEVKGPLVEVIEYLGEYHLDNECIMKDLEGFIKVLHLGIAEFPAYRQVYLTFLKQLAIYHPDTFQFVMKGHAGRLLLQELLYLYKNCRVVRNALLEFFEFLLRQFEINTITNLLNENFHTTIISLLKESPDPEQTCNCLKNVLLLFDRLRERHEEGLLNRVMNEMEEYGFEEDLSCLADSRHDEGTERVLAEILDEYYSDNMHQ